jgi:hypothetical protein
MNARYVMIGRDASSAVFFTEDAPTAHDIESVQVGMLQIVRLADLHCVDRNGGWTPIDPGGLTTVEIDGERHGPFHVPRSVL